MNKSAAYVCDIEKGRRGQHINPLLLVKLSEILDVPLSTLLRQANIEIDENSQKYRALLRMTRNKRRSARIVTALETCYSHAKALISETKTDVLAQATAKSLMDSLRELDSAISVG